MREGVEHLASEAAGRAIASKPRVALDVAEEEERDAVLRGVEGALEEATMAGAIHRRRPCAEERFADERGSVTGGVADQPGRALAHTGGHRVAPQAMGAVVEVEAVPGIPGIDRGPGRKVVPEEAVEVDPREASLLGEREEASVEGEDAVVEASVRLHGRRDGGEDHRRVGVALGEALQDGARLREEAGRIAVGVEEIAGCVDQEYELCVSLSRVDAEVRGEAIGTLVCSSLACQEARKRREPVDVERDAGQADVRGEVRWQGVPEEKDPPGPRVERGVRSARGAACGTLACLPGSAPKKALDARGNEGGEGRERGSLRARRRRGICGHDLTSLGREKRRDGGQGSWGKVMPHCRRMASISRRTSRESERGWRSLAPWPRRIAAQTSAISNW